MTEHPFDTAFRVGFVEGAKRSDNRALLSQLCRHNVPIIMYEKNPFPYDSDDGESWRNAYLSGLKYAQEMPLSRIPYDLKLGFLVG